MHPYPFKNTFGAVPLPRADRSRNRGKTPGLLRRWLAAAARNWQRQRTIAALEGMDDRLLRDIGIYRSDIRRIVNGSNHREPGMSPVSSAAVRTKRPQAEPALRGSVYS